MATPAPSVATEFGVKFTGAMREAQDRGELVAIATVFYNPAKDMIVMYFPQTITEEEAIAMLKRHRCFPK